MLISEFIELIPEKLNKKTESLTLFASAISKEYLSSITLADEMWNILIERYGDKSWYFSVLRLRNEIARTIGDDDANRLLLQTPERIDKWIIATTGEGHYKIYSLCDLMIRDNRYDKAVSLVPYSEMKYYSGNGINYIFHKMIGTLNEKMHADANPTNMNLNHDLRALDKEQIIAFMKACSDDLLDPVLQAIAKTWYYYYADLMPENERELVELIQYDIHLFSEFGSQYHSYGLFKLIYQARKFLPEKEIRIYLEEYCEKGFPGWIPVSRYSNWDKDIVRWYRGLIIKSVSCYRKFINKALWQEIEGLLDECCQKRKWNCYKDILGICISKDEYERNEIYYIRNIAKLCRNKYKPRYSYSKELTVDGAFGISIKTMFSVENWGHVPDYVNDESIRILLPLIKEIVMEARMSDEINQILHIIQEIEELIV